MHPGDKFNVRIKFKKAQFLGTGLFYFLYFLLSTVIEGNNENLISLIFVVFVVFVLQQFYVKLTFVRGDSKKDRLSSPNRDAHDAFVEETESTDINRDISDSGIKGGQHPLN